MAKQGFFGEIVHGDGEEDRSQSFLSGSPESRKVARLRSARGVPVSPLPGTGRFRRGQVCEW